MTLEQSAEENAHSPSIQQGMVRNSDVPDVDEQALGPRSPVRVVWPLPASEIPTEAAGTTVAAKSESVQLVCPEAHVETTGQAERSLQPRERTTESLRQERQVDMNDIVLHVINSLEGQLKEHGVIVHRELAAELRLIAGHRAQLREVIYNLVNNALEAMQATTSQSRVLHVRTESREEAIAVAIQDSGSGIDPNRLTSIFSAFVTTKAHGTGLGLAICRMIVERHGGRLTASSDGQSGALFPIRSTGRVRRMTPCGH
jgi:light-regulated signal transduction histidine kinase (bacteriophytochrome)